MDAKTATDRIAHTCGLIQADLRLATAIERMDGAMNRAERMRELAVTHRAHRAALLLDVATLVELAAIQICGKNLS